MAKLYVFGDSYSTPRYFVEPRDSWWGLMATELASNIDGIENYSWVGNNFNSIAHIIVSNGDMFNKDDYLVIGIPPVDRMTIVDAQAEHKKFVTFNTGLYEINRNFVSRHEGLAQTTIHKMSRDVVELWDRSWFEAQFMRQILTLNSYLENIVDHVMFVNLSEPFQVDSEWSVLEGLRRQIFNKSNMIVFKDTYYSTNFNINRPVDFDDYGWFGHQGIVGNRYWFEQVLQPKMKELKWL